MPFGRLGLVSFLHHTARSASVCRIPAISILLASTSAGLALAAKRSRVCPWWIAFWAGVAANARVEWENWLKRKTWIRLGEEAGVTLRNAASTLITVGDWLFSKTSHMSPAPSSLTTTVSSDPTKSNEKATHSGERSGESFPAQASKRDPRSEPGWDPWSTTSKKPSSSPRHARRPDKHPECTHCRKTEGLCRPCYKRFDWH